MPFIKDDLLRRCGIPDFCLVKFKDKLMIYFISEKDSIIIH